MYPSRGRVNECTRAEEGLIFGVERYARPAQHAAYTPTSLLPRPNLFKTNTHTFTDPAFCELSIHFLVATVQRNVILAAQQYYSTVFIALSPIRHNALL